MQTSYMAWLIIHISHVIDISINVPCNFLISGLVNQKPISNYKMSISDIKFVM